LADRRWRDFLDGGSFRSNSRTQLLDQSRDRGLGCGRWGTADGVSTGVGAGDDSIGSGSSTSGSASITGASVAGSTARLTTFTARLTVASFFGKYLFRIFSASSLDTEFDGTLTSTPSRRTSSMSRLVSSFNSLARS